MHCKRLYGHNALINLIGFNKPDLENFDSFTKHYYFVRWTSVARLCEQDGPGTSLRDGAERRCGGEEGACVGRPRPAEGPRDASSRWPQRPPSHTHHCRHGRPGQRIVRFLRVSDCVTTLFLFCSSAVLDPRVGHTMDVLSPFISVSVVLIYSSAGSPVHVLMLSIQAVRGLPRLRAPGIVPCIISFSWQLRRFLMLWP